MGEVFLKKNQTKYILQAQFFYQILSNQIVKITRNKEHEHGKVKTGAWPLNKSPKLRKDHLSICWDKLIFLLRCWLPTTMYHMPLLSEKWVESKYGKFERLGMVSGTWLIRKIDHTL